MPGSVSQVSPIDWERAALPSPFPPSGSSPPANPVSTGWADSNMEKPGCFYLGQEYDLNKKTVLPGPEHWIEYEAPNLTPHGVIVGMTGSGKTGLSIALLEEVAIPAIIIDPKGDLTNLLLQFPD